ncbi:ABC-type phosphate transport system substrate-binding protein [Saccharothrix carnea]|uniref:ABC-type phosphate transport system substrate-binding protein n=2 Tax=Saccharothrix carnea TaxID=1280637 RepID=A0A2P8I177_SACCR|nr:ABC-type phosphate transport system substrate-binding protein [Saccharothrix carnea]
MLGAAAAAVAAVALVASPAQADPVGTPAYRDIAIVGSDTTQTVMNGLSDAVLVNGTKVMGSYDARGSDNITTKATGCTIPRPASSGAGVTALVTSVEAGDNCVQAARSSSNNASSYAGKNLTYIPFAVDAMTYAVRSDSTVSKKLTTAQLKSIYNCTAPGVGTNFKPLLPQFGSGSRDFFLKQLGLTNTANYTTQFPCVVDVDVNGQPIQEHVGTYLTDTKHILPYSIAVYVSQIYGNAPAAQGKAVLATFNGVPPSVLNTASTFKRDVYNVVPTTKLGEALYDQVFTGGDSLICAKTDVITQYGFGVNPNCGSTQLVTPPAP